MQAPERFVEAGRPLRRGARRATARLRMSPTFIIIGAQRAGTTTLFTYLRKHPDVEGSKPAHRAVAWPKEIHFFDEQFDNGLNWYRSFFPLEARKSYRRLTGRDLIAGESTPYYLFHPLVPQRVAATVPDVRLVVLLRDPIERAYSHYQLMRRTGREKLSFEEAIEAEPKRLAPSLKSLGKRSPRSRRHPNHRHRAYAARSLYADQLERWLEYFPREQLLVVRSEDFAARTAEVYAEVLGFIGARPWRPHHFRKRNIGGYAPIDPDLRARLEERFAESNARVAALLGWDEAWGRQAIHGSPLHSRR